MTQTSDPPAKGQPADNALLSNIIFSSTLFVLLLILFCVLRTQFRGLYAPNLLNSRKQRVSKKVPDGFLRWISSVLSISDEELLPCIGVDGFVFLQTIKLFQGILVLIAIPAIFILIPVYFFFGTRARAGGNTQIFDQISAMNVESTSLMWITVIFNYYVAAVVIYSLYMFYRNLTSYRQAFIKDPACCYSQISLRKAAKSIGSVNGTQKLINIASRSVVVMNVSSKLNKENLYEMFNSMGFDDLMALVVVQNRGKVRKLLEKRNEAVVQFEKDILQFYLQIVAFIIDNRHDHDAGLGTTSNSRALDRGRLEDEYKDQMRIPIDERERLLQRLINEPRLLLKLRPVSREGNAEDVDLLIAHYKDIIHFDDELVEVANRFAQDSDQFFVDDSSSTTTAFLTSHGGVDVDSADRFLTNDAIVDWKQLTKLKDNLKDYGLTLWGTSMSIIVIFGSHRSASVCEQTLLSMRPFSMEAEPAPSADDVIWENLYLPNADRFVRGLAANVLYCIVNIFLTTANSIVGLVLNLETLEAKFPLLREFVQRYPSLKGILQGILAPLFFNLFILMAPYMLYGLAVFQGKISKTKVQESLLQKYTWLLFIQVFIMFVLSNVFVVILEQLINGQYTTIIQQILLYLPDKAAFYTNFVIQKFALSLMLQLINPAGLFRVLFTGFRSKGNYRLEASSAEPNKIFIGVLYPEYVVLVVMIVLAYIPLTPIISLAGLLFYGVAHVAFRYNFVFTYEIPQESGGRYWRYLPAPVLVGCITGQLFSIFQFSFSGGIGPALFMTPLVILTVASIVFLNQIFDRRTIHAPIGTEMVGKVEKVIDRMRGRQLEIVKGLCEELGEDFTYQSNNNLVSDASSTASSLSSDQTSLGLRKYEVVPFDFASPQKHPVTGDINVMDDGESAYQNPYCNPILFKRYPLIFFPPCFFHALKEALAVQEGPNYT